MTSAFAEGGGELAFFTSAIDVLKVVIILIGAGLAVWGVINLLEGYGNDNPGAKSQGMKQLMAGVGVALIGILLVPQLNTLFKSQTGGTGA
ncbi:MAG: Maff2 family mobile element protein [Oscillospiraceae bacterium]